MPLINALLFMVLAGVGIAGYTLSRHFEKMEVERYLERRDRQERLPRRDATVMLYEINNESNRFRKAG